MLMLALRLFLKDKGGGGTQHCLIPFKPWGWDIFEKDGTSEKVEETKAIIVKVSSEEHPFPYWG